MVPMREHTKISVKLMRELADMKLHLSGLSPHAATLQPSDLSGGMQKRAALARALALDPELLFLDEPTAGLDPVGAAAFDQLILSLRRALGLTVVMITHDLDSLFTICDLFVIEGRRSQIDSLLDDGGSVVESVQKTLNSLMRTLDDESIRDFQNILSNLEQITSEYRDNPLTAERIERTLSNIDRAAKDVSVASVSVDQTSLDTRLAINDKFSPLLDSLQGTITEVDQAIIAYRQ